MKHIINEAIIPLLNEGFISNSQMHDLIEIKEFIDRVSTREYVSPEEQEVIYNKLGVYPTLLTWGDYFQSDLALYGRNSSDDEFSTVVDTIKFDVMSSHSLFSGNKREFADWIEASYLLYNELDPEKMSEDEQEIMHLKILKDYFYNMGIVDNFTEAEKQWYMSFRQEKAV